MCATYNQESLSSLLAEEQAFCAHLGAVRSSSSSEGLARAPGVSSEASLESNEVRPLLISYLSSPSPFFWCHGGGGAAGDANSSFEMARLITRN